MKLFSYTDHEFPSPPAFLNDDRWPVQLSPGFARFYHEFYDGDILLVHDSETDAWLPFHRIINRLAKFGQILHAPVRYFEEISEEKQHFFFNKLLKFMKHEEVIHRFIQPHPFGIMLSKPDNCKSIRFGTYVTDLSAYPDDHQLLYSFDPKYRKAIQHSIKNEGRVVFGRDAWRDFYKLYECTAQRTGMYQDTPQYFAKLREHLGEDHTETGVIYDGDTPIGGIFMVYSLYSALCTHAGSGGESKLYGGVKHLHYEMMRHLRDKGVMQYDLVGVRIGGRNPALEGIFRFKRGFGGQLKEGYLWKADIEGMHLRIYDMMQRFKNPNLKPDIIDQESNEE